jgi:opacity protein-like surface antigen
MKKIYAAAIWSLILAPAQAFAADLDSFKAQDVSSQPLVEIGNGWYIRGDIGASIDSTPSLSFDPGSITVPPPASISPNNGPVSSKTNFETGLGVGYKFNNYFRVDGTIDYHTGLGNSTSAPGIICPYTATGLTSQTAVGIGGTPLELGYAYNPNETCNANLQLNQQNYTGLINGYVDLFTYWGVTPYIGAGAGVNMAQTSGTLAYTKTSDGSSYRADLTPTGTFPQIWVNPVTGNPIAPQPKIAFAPQNWDRTLKNTKYSLAIALTAGVGITLSPEMVLDLSYRYLDMGSSSYVVNPQTGATISQKNTAQDVRIGIRYTPE